MQNTVKLCLRVNVRLFATLVVFNLPVQASETLTSLSIDAIGKKAVENAASLKAQAKETLALTSDVSAAGLLSNPVLSVQIGKVESGGAAGTSIEPSLTQVLPFFGKLSARQSVAEAEKRLQYASLEEAKVLVQHEATSTAFRLTVLSELSKHLEERQKRFQLMRGYLKSHPQVSPSQRVESYLIHGQILLLERGFLEAERARKALLSRLQFLVKGPERVVPIPQWVSLEKFPSRETFEKSWMEKNPEVKRKKLEVEKAQASLRQAELNPLPDLILGLGYRNESLAPANRFIYGSIGISIPIFDRGQHSIPAASARLEAGKTLEEYQKAEVALEFDEAWLKLEGARALLKKFPIALVSEAETQFSQAEREYRKGRISTSVLLQSDSQIHEIIETIFRTQLDAIEDLSKIYQFAGQELPWK